MCKAWFSMVFSSVLVYMLEMCYSEVSQQGNSLVHLTALSFTSGGPELNPAWVTSEMSLMDSAKPAVGLQCHTINKQHGTLVCL